MPAGIKIGDREVFLLSMLIEQKLYGYQIAQMLNDHASFFLEIDQSGVYNTLRKLEKQDWVSVAMEKAGNAPIRKLYQITPGGTGQLENLPIGRNAPDTAEHSWNIKSPDQCPMASIEKAERVSVRKDSQIGRTHQFTIRGS